MGGSKLLGPAFQGSADALGAIDGLKDALARVRKFGGRCVLGFQSIGQVSALYGRGDAQTIVENCGNTLILRCSASEGGGTAQFASHLIGQREILRRHVSRTDARETSCFTNACDYPHATPWPFVPMERYTPVAPATRRASSISSEGR